MHWPNWQKPVPDTVLAAYNLKHLSFVKYIIPKPLDSRLLTVVAPAVARAAMESGVARHKITDREAYIIKLHKMMNGYYKFYLYIKKNNYL